MRALAEADLQPAVVQAGAGFHPWRTAPLLGARPPRLAQLLRALQAVIDFTPGPQRGAVQLMRGLQGFRQILSHTATATATSHRIRPFTALRDATTGNPWTPPTPT